MRPFPQRIGPQAFLWIRRRVPAVIQAFQKRDGLICRTDQETAPFELHHHQKASLAERQGLTELQGPRAAPDFHFAHRLADGVEQLRNRP
jgi:hypothetical protein